MFLALLALFFQVFFKPIDNPVDHVDPVFFLPDSMARSVMGAPETEALNRIVCVTAQVR